MKETEFQQLCALVGMTPAPTENGGQQTPLLEQERLILLAAWGIDADKGGNVEEIIETLRREHWQQLIPRVQVVGEGDSIPVVLRLPETMRSVVLYWHLVQENGLIQEDTLSLALLEVLEETQLGGERYVALRLDLGHQVPEGYHRLRVSCGYGTEERVEGEGLVIVTPSTCYTPPGLQEEARIWGISCHLETIRSRRNWGCGDLTDLHHILGWAAENGAGTVAVSSLLTRRNPENESPPPSLPSDLSFPDPLFLDLEAVADFQESEEARFLVNTPSFQVRLALLRESTKVEYEEVAALKREVADVLWRNFQLNHLNPETERGGSYRHFQQAGGQRLQAFALYQALQEHRQAGIGTEEEEPLSGSVFSGDDASFTMNVLVDSYRDRIEYHQYLQWQLELQLASAGQRSMELGLKVGLTQTIPAGVDSQGFAVWYEPALFGTPFLAQSATEDRICCPEGPPMLMSRLAAAEYNSFIAMLRANMRYAGAVCFNAVDMLDRQRWNLQGQGSGRDLAVAQSFEDVLGIIALESRRNRCLVIGQYQGGLSDPFSQALAGRGILMSRGDGFARDAEGEWLAPCRYPANTVVKASRDDLCSLDGFWRGADIALLSNRCPGFAEEARERAVVARALDRALFLVALNHQHLLPPGYDVDPAGVPDMTPVLIRAAYSFLARTPAKIMLVNMADLVDLTELESWSGRPMRSVFLQRLAVDFENLVAAEPLRQLFREFCNERALGVVRPSAPLSDRRDRRAHLLPRAFYRMQFGRDCTFLQAAERLPYLRELGITHCYASPYLKARPGSAHGYDIIDHASLNPEIGTREEYEIFVAALERNGMAQILDMVPNHMGVGPDNGWWVDVLENGQASPYAPFFDINWDPQEEALKNRILLPVLGDYFGSVLEQGHLQLVFGADKGRFSIAYYDHRYPIAPRTYPVILRHDLHRLEAKLGSQHEGFLELQNLIASFAGLPGREETDLEQIEMRNRNKEVLKRLLARLCREVVEIKGFIEENIIYFNGEPGSPESFTPLEGLLAMQAFRLAFWRVASDEINYRRFFDINDLAGIRMERKEVFDQTHRLVLDLIATGKIDGLRIDHPDGLYDPESYFRTLQTAVSGVPTEYEFGVDGQSVRKQQAELPLYVAVEKILAHSEQLPDTWMVHGTTGYDFACLLNGLFVDQAAEEKMTALYHQFIGRDIDFSVLVHDCKRLIIKTAMAGEINVLSDQLHRLAKRNRYTQDYTLNGLREALTEIVAFFPVYRTYCAADRLGENDSRHVELAVERAKTRWQVEDTSIYEFIKSILLLETMEEADQRHGQELLDFVKKFQQYTGPVMAKGLEDTAFYIYNRLLSLNEVGDDPCRFGVSITAFHAVNRERVEKWPYAMLTTSTHDSKRSEDVRARINVLSEMTEEWGQAVNRWHEMNRRWKTVTGQGGAPSKNDEYALYQNLLGTWPIEEMNGEARDAFQGRVITYMLKAIREAKVHTSWLNNNHLYEQAMADFIAKLLSNENRNFLDDFGAFQKQTAWFGMLNSLSQLVLKLTAPGIPDTYQGNETWNFRLVDPDNRRPVDFAGRQEMLTALQGLVKDDSVPLASRLHDFLRNSGDGRIKMYVLWKILTFRRENPDIFLHGSYLPLYANGAARKHLCAFARMHEGQGVIVAAPRLMVGLMRQDASRMPLGREVWGKTLLHLPRPLEGHRLTNILSGEEIGAGTGPEKGLLAAEIFRHFPVALLACDQETATRQLLT